ncbi:MAG: hypothetical protein ACI905_000952, partial [Roseivirga sp.]
KAPQPDKKWYKRINQSSFTSVGESGVKRLNK